MVRTRGGTYDTPTATIVTTSEASQGKRPKNKQPKLAKTKEARIKGLDPDFECEKEESPTPVSPVGAVQHKPMANPLDAMMAPRGPPIVMPEASTPPNLPCVYISLTINILAAHDMNC